jgi:hypothetical protein
MEVLMPQFSLGEKVKIAKAAESEGSNANFVGQVGEVARNQQVGPGGFVVDVSFEGQTQTLSFWERWLEKA